MDSFCNSLLYCPILQTFTDWIRKPVNFTQSTVILLLPFILMVDRDSIVGIATRYGLDGPCIESRWGCDFPHYPDWPWGPSSFLWNGYWVLPRVKWLGRGIDHPPPSSADVKERVQLYLYSPSGPLWPVIGWTLPIFILMTAEHFYPKKAAKWIKHISAQILPQNVFVVIWVNVKQQWNH